MHSKDVEQKHENASNELRYAPAAGLRCNIWVNQGGVKEYVSGQQHVFEVHQKDFLNRCIIEEILLKQDTLTIGEAFFITSALPRILPEILAVQLKKKVRSGKTPYILSPCAYEKIFLHVRAAFCYGSNVVPLFAPQYTKKLSAICTETTKIRETKTTSASYHYADGKWSKQK